MVWFCRPFCGEVAAYILQEMLLKKKMSWRPPGSSKKQQLYIKNQYRLLLWNECSEGWYRKCPSNQRWWYWRILPRCRSECMCGWQHVCVDGSMKILKMCMGNKKKIIKDVSFYYFILGYHFNRMFTFKLFCNIIKNYLKFYLYPMTENIENELANHF